MIILWKQIRLVVIKCRLNKKIFETAHFWLRSKINIGANMDNINDIELILLIFYCNDLNLFHALILISKL